MTIALSLKVVDGVVLASDSASSIWAQDENNQMVGVVNIYNNADKVFNLCKGFPIGAITWGSGSIGPSSISTLMKDFRKRLTSEIDTSQYTIGQIAADLARFVYEDHYRPAFQDWKTKPSIGFMVVGYSANHGFAEEWRLEIVNGELSGPQRLRGEDQVGVTWNGEPEAIMRLYFGVGARTSAALMEMGFDEAKAQEIASGLRDRLTVPFVIAPMPIQDAIDLARFLVDLTREYTRFTPGAPTVGGPTDIAVITKHEGFKWVQRKHYFPVSLNPIEEGPQHD